LDLASVPVLPGAADQMAAGVNSSLQENNERALSDFSADPACDANQLRLLVDPQTSGGLLAGVPADRADECLQALHAAGYSQAARIGQVRAGEWRILAQQGATADPSSGE
jgi:selenide,water dikinase